MHGPWSGIYLPGEGDAKRVMDVNRTYITILLVLLLLLLVSCRGADDSEPSVRRVEIHRVITACDSFDIDNLDIERTWIFTSDEDLKFLLGLFNLHPGGSRPASAETYFVEIYDADGDDGYVEKWFMWLDSDPDRSGAAENEVNPQQYTELDPDTVSRLRQLLIPAP